MYQRATTQKCVISTKLFLQASVTRVTTDYTVKHVVIFLLRFEKRAINDGGNENSARKAWHVIQYTHQQLNRRRKALVP